MGSGDKGDVSLKVFAKQNDTRAHSQTFMNMNGKVDQSPCQVS